MTGPASPTHPAGPAPSVRRRFASLVYEVLILFGVALLPGAVGALLLAVTGRPQDALARLAAFAIFAGYFIFFWTRRGQTLPMQTWHIRLVTAAGGKLTWQRAAVRCMAACLWIAPAAALAWAIGLTRWPALLAVGLGVLAYGLSARVLPHRQFLHDLLCGTRLVDVQPAVAARSTR